MLARTSAYRRCRRAAAGAFHRHRGCDFPSLRHRQLRFEALENRWLLSVYYVSPTGSDSNPGTSSSPFETPIKAFSVCATGDTIYFRGSTDPLNPQPYDIFQALGGSTNPADDVPYQLFQPTTRGPNVAVGVTDLTIAAYPGEYVRFDGAYQLPWIQDTATTWHADVSGLPQFAGTGAWSDWAGTLTSVTAHVVDGFEATNIYPRATCVAGTTAPSGLEGASGGTNPAQTYLSLFRELHDGQRYFVCSNDDSPGSGANYYLFWNAALSKWVISNTLSDDVVDYWSLDTGETDPQSASEYQPHGACCGTIECTRADMTGIPADFTDFPVQTQNSDDALTTYYNDNGTNKLLYDLFYFDWQNLVVYFRSNEVNPITDPDTQLWVKQGQYSDFWLSAVSPPATGVTIEGITFGWGTNIRGVATDCTFSNFTMLGGAIQANISNSLFEQGYFDFLGGDALLRSSGVYEESRYVHDFYINGSGGGHDTIRDTFIGRDLSGSSMSLTEGSDTVYDVVSYGAELGPMVWGTGHMFNFVGINAPYLAQGVVAQGMNDWAWMLWGDSNDEQLDHSYLEITACGAYGVLGDYDTVVATGTEVDDNVVAAEGWTNGIVTYDPFYFMSYGSGVSFSSISNNLFIADRDVGGRFGGGTALQAYSHTAFLDYLAGQGYAGNAYSLDTSDYLDVAAADAFLDSQPSLADAMAYFRGHAAAMAAANGATASQGPVLNLVYGNHPQTVTASTTLELLDDSGQVIIGDEIIDISKNNGALVWGGVSLSLGESQTLLAGDVMYAVTYSGYDNILVCPLTTVTGVSSTAAADAQYTLGGTVPIAVTFSQAVNVSGTLQLALNDGGVANYAGGSGTAMLTFNYVVAVGQETSDLDYASTDALALNGGSIRDLAGNAAVLGLPATCTDGLASLNVTINTGPPTITDVFSSVAADSEFGMDATVPIIVAFSQPVTVDTTGGTPQLALNANSTAAATYVSGSGTDALTFDYAVAAGDATSPLDYTSTAALTLNGGTIENVVGQAANFTLPATRTDGLAAADIVIDSSKTLVVPPADWTSAGLTLALGGAGNLYVTGLSGDVVPPCPPAGVWNIVIAAPDAPTGDLTIDSSNGNPIPAGGLTYCGGGGLIITGGGSLTLSLPNTYTGGTFVSEGVLVAENSAAIPSGSTLSVGPDGSVVLGDPAASEPLALAQTGAGGLQQPDTAGTTAAAAPAPAAASTAAAVQTAAAALAPTLAPVVAAVPAPLVPPATAMAPTTVVVVATTAAEPGRASLDPAPAAIPSSTVSPLPSDRPSAVSRLSSAWLSAVSALSGPLASASWFASAVPYSDAAVPGQPGGQPAAAAAFQVAASGTAASCEATDEALLRLARFPARRAATQAGLEHPAVPRSSGLACETLDLLARSIAKRQ